MVFGCRWLAGQLTAQSRRLWEGLEAVNRRVINLFAPLNLSRSISMVRSLITGVIGEFTELVSSIASTSSMKDGPAVDAGARVSNSRFLAFADVKFRHPRGHGSVDAGLRPSSSMMAVSRLGIVHPLVPASLDDEAWWRSFLRRGRRFRPGG